MKTAPFSVGAPRGAPAPKYVDSPASLLEESPKSITGRPRATPTNSILADSFKFKAIASNIIHQTSNIIWNNGRAGVSIRRLSCAGPVFPGLRCRSLRPFRAGYTVYGRQR